MKVAFEFGLLEMFLWAELILIAAAAVFVLIMATRPGDSGGGMVVLWILYFVATHMYLLCIPIAGMVRDSYLWREAAENATLISKCAWSITATTVFVIITGYSLFCTLKK